MIDIAMAFDDAFWAPTYATMRSICLTTHHPEQLRFHLLHRSLTPAHHDAIASIGRDYGATLDAARAKVKVAAGTQPGQRVRLKGKGMPVLRSKDVGDLYVQLDIETPQALSRRQRELLEEFARLETGETNPTSDGFFSKLKKMFEV